MARLFSRIQKVWQKALGACSFQSLRRAWDRWGFYVSLALALTLIGYGAVAIRNRPAREVAPVAAMQPALASPAPTATAAPMPLFQWPLSGEILMAHSPESAVYQPALGAFTAHEGVDIASRAGETVCAAADGTVVAFYAFSQYGYVLEIAHVDGLVTRYGGLSATALGKAANACARGRPLLRWAMFPAAKAILGRTCISRCWKMALAWNRKHF